MMTNKIALSIVGLLVFGFGIACIFFPHRLQRYTINNFDSFKFEERYYRSKMFIVFLRATGVFLIGMFFIIIYLILYVA